MPRNTILLLSVILFFLFFYHDILDSDSGVVHEIPSLFFLKDDAIRILLAILLDLECFLLFWVLIKPRLKLSVTTKFQLERVQDNSWRELLKYFFSKILFLDLGIFFSIYLIKIFFKFDCHLFFTLLNCFSYFFRLYLDYIVFYLFLKKKFDDYSKREILISSLIDFSEMLLRLNVHTIGEGISVVFKNPDFIMMIGDGVKIPGKFTKYLDKEKEFFEIPSVFGCFSQKVREKLGTINFTSPSFSDYRELTLILEIFYFCIDGSATQTIFIQKYDAILKNTFISWELNSDEIESLTSILESIFNLELNVPPNKEKIGYLKWREIIS